MRGAVSGFAEGAVTVEPKRKNCLGGRIEMKILLLVSSDVRTYYSALLMQRGHQIIAHGGGAALNEYMECDGCLLLSVARSLTADCPKKAVQTQHE
jgi:hypothetical protein